VKRHEPQSNPSAHQPKADALRAEAQGFSSANKKLTEGDTALPKAGVKPEGRNGPIYRLCF
jgi:hypothetical protein